MILAVYKNRSSLRRSPAVAAGLLCACVMGSAHAAVNGLTPTDFTNNGVVSPSPGQYENNLSNNTASVVVLPKGMVISKTADTSALSNPIEAGDQITYNITAKNLGLLGLTNVTLNDSIVSAAAITLVSGDTNGDEILDANEEWVWQGVYTVSQSDIDTNGGGDADIDNTVIVSTDELPAMTAAVAVPITQVPSFTVEKSVDQSAIAAPSTLNYIIEITNTGNQTLSAVTASDTLPDGSVASLSGPATDVGQVGVLDPGEVWQFTTSYSATQAVIDAGNKLVNSVSVVTAETGVTPRTATAETEVKSDPGFTVAKVVDEETISAPATLAYNITIVNTGNVSLTGVTPTDTLPDGTTGILTGPIADTGAAGVLDVAETWVYNISYPVSQAVIDSGVAQINRVTVGSNETAAVGDDAITNIVREPSFTVAKTVDLDSVSAPGQLRYNMVIENTGNVTLSNVVVADQLSNGASPTLIGPTTDTGVAGAIDVGESWLYTAAYLVNQNDIDTGIDLTNTFTVNTDGLEPQTATAVTAIDSTPELEIAKTVDHASMSVPGTLNYVIEVSNTGNVGLHNVVPIDTMPDGTIATLTGPVTDVGSIGTLDVGETWQYTTRYTVSQSDIDSGQPKNNTVTVTSDETGVDGFTATATTTIDSNPDFTVEKTVDLAQISAPGVLAYNIAVSNTGNTTLTGITVNDTLPDGSVAVLSGPSGDVGITAALDVGETWTYNTAYTASQEDINSGAALVNSVTVSTVEAGSKTDAAETNVDQQPGIAIVKAALETQFTIAGDIIRYAFLVENTGNLLLTDVQVSDPIADAGSVRCLPPGQPVSSQLSTGPYLLAPADKMNCTAQRTVAVADVAATRVDNQAFVSAKDPQGNTVDADSQVVTVPMSIMPPLATNDQFNSPVSAVPVVLPGGANDRDVNGDKDNATVSLIDPDALDTDGDGDFDSLIVPGEGVWLVDNATGNVTFTPEAGFTADPTSVNYTISDRSGQVSNVAVLSINYPQTAPLAKNDLKVNPAIPSPANPTVVNVLADNGSGMDSDAENDLSIATIAFVDANAIDTDNDGDADNLMVAGEGVWNIDNASGEVTFTPESGFFADPTPVNYTISDRNGIVSNEATITIDYPQSAPLAVNDQRLDQPLAVPVVVVVLGNDSDPEGNLDPATVKLIDPVTESSVVVLPIAGEGVWRVDPVTGDITFTPDAGFITNPTPVDYTVFDTTEIESNRATVIVTFETPATIAGTAWLDKDRDGQVGVDEERKAGWTLKLLDSNGNVVATTVTDANGDYQFVNLIPAEYTVEFYNNLGVYMDSAQTIGPVLSGQTVLLPLPVDPSGVVYDSIDRTPVEGVMLHLVNAAGTVIDPACLRDNQQGQVTAADGLYAFDVFPDAHTSCGDSEVYRIEIAAVPDDYHPNFSSIIRQQGAASCGSPEIGCAVSGTFDSDPLESRCTVDAILSTSACEVQAQADAPQMGDDTRYYVEFELESGDQNVIFNHLPVDARANDAEIVLTKNADRKTTSTGSLVLYTLTAENLKQVPAFDIEIVDTPPAGFVHVSDSVVITRAGADAQLDTDDDVSTALSTVSGTTLNFESLDFEAEEKLLITYVMKVGAGVINGRYANRVKASGPAGEASNEAVATVEVISDAVLSQATLIGKVFFDRDKDGIQDSGGVSRLTLTSAYYGTLELPDLPARNSINDNPELSAVTINMPKVADNRFRISSREGTRIEIDENGSVTEAHIGDRARGTNAQDIKVCTRHTVGIPTLGNGSMGSDPVDVIEIVISNLGISEPGIPGARLATASGLIIEADRYGRYNIPDVDSGTTASGRNFILKVDPSSLPDGAVFTTENPYVLRIDGNALNRMNFGVLLPESRDRFAVGCEPQMAAAYQTVEVNLGSVFFDTDDASIRDDQRGVVADIIKTLSEYGGGAITIGANTDSRLSFQYNIALAERRANTIRDVLRRELGDSLMSTVSVEVDPAAYEEADR